jgi:hypothetical protein
MLRKKFPVGHEKERDYLLNLVRQRAYGSQTRISKFAQSNNKAAALTAAATSHQPPAMPTAC